MDIVTLFIVSIRAAALAMALSGNDKASNHLYALADAVEAGKLTDDDMAAVAEKLRKGPPTDADWDDVWARIHADRDRLHAPSPDDGGGGTG